MVSSATGRKVSLWCKKKKKMKYRRSTRKEVYAEEEEEEEEEEEGSDIVNSCEFLNVLSAVACAAASADPLQCSIVFAQ
jgi:hypothetical protein